MYARIKERAAFYFTEQGGFEPPVPRSTTVFKTAALNHSATAPESVCILAQNNGECQGFRSNRIGNILSGRLCEGLT